MIKSNKEYYLFHLLNDFSGSPMVLKQVAEILLSKGHKVTIVTAKGEGFLSDIQGAKYKYINYKWNPNRAVTLLAFLLVQFKLFIFSCCLPKSSIAYVNTLLPFGAALGASCRGLNVFYHLHEPQVEPSLLFKLLKKVSRNTSNKQIYVSNYLAEVLQDIWINERVVVHNSVSEKYLAFIKDEKVRPKEFTVIMACSQKEYKGIYEFVTLAKRLTDIRFKLILNSQGDVFQEFINSNDIPENCIVLSAQSDMTPHFLESSILLNLSHTDKWIESFGLTLVEAMCFGIPVIAPNIGGPLEIVEDNVSGYCINVKDLDVIGKHILDLHEDQKKYSLMSKNAKKRASNFSIIEFHNKITKFLDS